MQGAGRLRLSLTQGVSAQPSRYEISRNAKLSVSAQIKATNIRVGHAGSRACHQHHMQLMG